MVIYGRKKDRVTTILLIFQASLKSALMFHCMLVFSLFLPILTIFSRDECKETLSRYGVANITPQSISRVLGKLNSCIGVLCRLISLLFFKGLS